MIVIHAMNRTQPNTLKCINGAHIYMSNDIEETNGGRHTRLGMDFFRLPPQSLKVAAKILHDGARSHEDETGENWRRIPVHVHLNHALVHLYEHLGSDLSEDHLGHALVRLLMAVEVERKGGLPPL